jgi:molybdopterin-guanine dinucleotide biosynthesis protein A
MSTDGPTVGSESVRWDAVILAGGRARRMAGDDKLLLDVGGRSMLARVVDAVAGAGTTVVVGQRRALEVEVRWCREQPEGSGPAAALRAGLQHVTAGLVVLVAGDQPFVDAATVRRLVAGVRDAPVRDDGAVAVDASLQPQWLCSAWRTDALRTAPLAANESLRVALGQLQWRPLTVDPRAVMDCDTPEDLRRARELAQ